MFELHLNRHSSALPLYAQIVEQLSWHILHGQLKSGEYLPPSRELARQLGVSRGIVVRAYETLCAKGLCQSQVGQGTKVIAAATDTMPPVSNIIAPQPVPETFLPGGLSLLPSHASTDYLPVSDFRQAFNRILRYPGRLNQFEESAGNLELRQLICDKILPSRGIIASPSQVLIVPGTQYGSVLLAMTMMNERTTFHFGDPGYLEFAHNFARFGYQLQPHPMDKEGINLKGFSGSDQDILYMMPEHHFPQCITLSASRRQTVIQKARENNILILEDDYDSEFYFDRVPQPALRASEAADHIVYMGTFSKVIFNSMRLGYLVANEEIIKKMASLHWSLSRGTSGLLQLWVGELIKNGTYERHTKRMRTVYRHKRDTLIQLIQKYLPNARFTIPSGGLQLYIRFPDPLLSQKIMQWLQINNIQTAPSRHYNFTSSVEEPFLILGFANSETHDVEIMLQKLQHFLA